MLLVPSVLYLVEPKNPQLQRLDSSEFIWNTFCLGSIERGGLDIAKNKAGGDVLWERLR